MSDPMTAAPACCHVRPQKKSREKCWGRGVSWSRGVRLKPDLLKCASFTPSASQGRERWRAIVL